MDGSSQSTCVNFVNHWNSMPQATSGMIHKDYNNICYHNHTHSIGYVAFDCICIMTNLLPYIWENMAILLPFLDIQVQFQRAIGFCMIQGFVWKAYHVPLTAYRTFVIQKKYKMTSKTFDLFVYDLVVEGVLVVIIFPPIIYGYLRIVQLGGTHFYVYLQVFILIITVLLTEIHPKFIAPLFNDFHPITNPKIINDITRLCQLISFPLEKILWMNGSVRSGHCNAYFYGIGSQRVIVLYDTLLRKLNSEQTVAVIAHQLGHWKCSHSLQSLFLYMVEGLSLFYIFSFFMHNEDILISFGFTHRSVFISTALFFHLFEPLTAIFEILLLIQNRRLQFQADAYACQKGYAQGLKRALIQLYQDQYNKGQPDWLYSWVRYSHPSIHQRIHRINLYIEISTKFN